MAFPVMAAIGAISAIGSMCKSKKKEAKQEAPVQVAQQQAPQQNVGVSSAPGSSGSYVPTEIRDAQGNTYRLACTAPEKKDDNPILKMLDPSKAMDMVSSVTGSGGGGGLGSMFKGIG